MLTNSKRMSQGSIGPLLVDHEQFARPIRRLRHLHSIQRAACRNDSVLTAEGRRTSLEFLQLGPCVLSTACMLYDYLSGKDLETGEKVRQTIMHSVNG